MRIYYDAEADVLAIWIAEDQREADSINPLPGVTITLNKDGSPVLVEILDASHRYGSDVLQSVSLDRLVSLAEAARTYGLAPGYLRALAEKGRLTAKKVGRNWVTTPGWVEDYLHSRRYNAKPVRRPASGQGGAMTPGVGLLPDGTEVARTRWTDV